jgi:hypothetical protein
MDGSTLLFIVMPIVIALTLAIMIALPFIAGRRRAQPPGGESRIP